MFFASHPIFCPKFRSLSGTCHHVDLDENEVRELLCFRLLFSSLDCGPRVNQHTELALAASHGNLGLVFSLSMGVISLIRNVDNDVAFLFSSPVNRSNLL